MSEDAKSAKSQILIAIIGLVGVLGAGLFANWDKIFPSQHQTSQDNAVVSQKAATPAQQTIPQKTTSPTDRKPTVADAERLTTRYLAALKRRDTDSVVEMISVPFFFGQKILVSKDEVRAGYELLFTDVRKFENIPPIESLIGQTVEDFKRMGETRGGNLQADRVLRSLRLEDGDFVVVVIVRKESNFFFFRHYGSTLRMAGTCAT